MTEKPNIAIIGSGIIGMTTALSLHKVGYRPTVISKDDVGQTTSAVAAAFWYPFKAGPVDKVADWSQRSLTVFREEQSIPEAGIVWRQLTEYLAPDSTLPWWHESVDEFQCDEHPINMAVGYRLMCSYKIPIIDTSIYLAYLQKSLKQKNVTFQRIELSSIDEAFDLCGTVVNCSGINSMKLANDSDLHPARGQVIRIKKRPSHKAMLDGTGDPKIAHVTPRINDTILGGTYENNVANLTPDPVTTAEIIKRCQGILPELGELSSEDILSVSCGLRPVRSSVRVEAERHPKGWLFHNYGHGGAGFTLSWGCAEEICRLVEAAGV